MVFRQSLGRNHPARPGPDAAMPGLLLPRGWLLGLIPCGNRTGQHPFLVRRITWYLPLLRTYCGRGSSVQAIRAFPAYGHLDFFSFQRGTSVRPVEVGTGLRIGGLVGGLVSAVRPCGCDPCRFAA